jgi:hypothetical protein
MRRWGKGHDEGVAEGTLEWESGQKARCTEPRNKKQKKWKKHEGSRCSGEIEQWKETIEEIEPTPSASTGNETTSVAWSMEARMER